jgi:hypothetical protein
VNWDYGVALFPLYFTFDDVETDKDADEDGKKKNKKKKKKISSEKFLEWKQADRVAEAYDTFVFPESRPDKWKLIPLALPLEKYMKGPCESYRQTFGYLLVPVVEVTD